MFADSHLYLAYAMLTVVVACVVGIVVAAVQLYRGRWRR